MRLTVVVTSRPSVSRITSAVEALSRAHDVTVVMTAQALTTRTGAVANDVGWKIERLPTYVDDATGIGEVKTTALTLSDLGSVLARLQPELVITIADRYETLATAIAATYQNIPLLHVQGGEHTGCIDDRVRHAVTQLADYHAVSTEDAKREVLRMQPDAHVAVTGCPSIDLATRYLETPVVVPTRGDGRVVDVSRPYALVMQHPVTTEPMLAPAQMRETLTAMTLPYVGIWPNLDAGSAGTSKVIREWGGDGWWVRNLPPQEFLPLLREARVVVGNSSTLVREAAFYGVPAVLVGTRQMGRPLLGAMPAGSGQVAQALATVTPRPRSDYYGDGRAGVAIADFVMRTAR